MNDVGVADTVPGRGPLRSRRLLALAGDERLVDQIRRGNDVAFEVAFERHAPAILGFCRHMLGSVHEAEDAVQQTFASAHRALQGDHERKIVLKAWLFAIARNRCLSMLRARRDEPLEEVELPTAGLSEQVERRAELRSLVADVRELPEEQRAALLLTELADLSHAEVAQALGCQVARVKALVFRARTALIQRRDARGTPCEQIQEQLATVRRGGLRRTDLRLHLRDCPACRAYRAQVKQQRQMLALALPVVPGAGLKSSVLAAAGIGGGGAGGGGLAAGGIGAGLAKVAVAGALAGGGAVAGDAALDRGARPQADRPAESRTSYPAPSAPASEARSAQPDLGTAREIGRPSKARARRRAASASPGRAARGKPTGAARGKGRPDSPGRSADRARGRGPVEAPPAATPVRRGPPATSPGSGNAAGPPAHKPAPVTKPPASAAPPKPPGHSKPPRTARP